MDYLMLDKNQWVIKIKDELDSLRDTSTQSHHWSKRSIYRIPVSVTDLNQRAYMPQIVSFGPYYYNAENLRAMEKHKHRVLLHFLKRANKPLESFVNALDPVVADLKEAYDGLDAMPEIANDMFLELMILDGCFMLEILRTAMVTETGDEEEESDDSEEDYAFNDPIFGIHGDLNILPYLKRDMLMLENQIPMMVLEKIVAVQNDGLQKRGPGLIHLILNFFSQSISPGHLPQFQTPLHILHIYHTSLLLLEPQPKKLLQEPQPNKKKGEKSAATVHGGGHSIFKAFIPEICIKHSLQDTSKQDKKKGEKSAAMDHGGDEIIRLPRTRAVIYRHIKRKSKKSAATDHGGDDIIRSATELVESGIRIKKSPTRCIKDISFHRGILKLPLIVVDDFLESLYLNLIAFERFHVGAGNEITSYVFFMDNIIDSARDVSLLHSCGIIQNALGSDKEVARLFNSLSKDIVLDPESSLYEVRKNVNAYCQRSWNQWRANLMHTYFTNPWVILSVVAALVLFALTILQTVYTVLSYVKPPR